MYKLVLVFYRTIVEVKWSDDTQMFVNRTAKILTSVSIHNVFNPTMQH